jgi:hypothetical protein
MIRQRQLKRNRRISLEWIESLEPRSLLTGSTIDVTTSADSGTGSLRQAIIQADAIGGQQSVSIVFDLPTTDPGYNATTGGWALTVDSTEPTLFGSGITIDLSLGPITIPGGITVSGISGVGGSLTLLGNGQDSVFDAPDPSTTGTGSLTDGGLSLEYSGIGSLAFSNLSSLTLLTPNAGNSLTTTSPATGQNQVSGTSGGVSIAPLTFSNVANVTLDTANNDESASPDSITIDSYGLVASGLANFTVETGSTNATLTILASSLALPVPGGSLVDQATSGFYNTVVAQADVNYALNSSSLAISGSGSITLDNVQDVQLTGGADSTLFSVAGWSGDLGLNGGPGSNQLLFDDPGTYAGHLSLSNFGSSSIEIDGNFDGTISAPQALTINQILIEGNDDAGSSILAGAYVAPAGSVAPAIQILGDVGGSITASENLAISGSGVISTIQIDGSLLVIGKVMAGAIGTITINQNLDGNVTAAGGGTIGTIIIGGNLTGSVEAPEDPNPGSGTIGTITIIGTMSGSITSGNITKVQVNKALIGVIITSGAGIIGSVTVGGDLSGTVDAELDPNSTTSAELGSITVGGTLSGTISAVRQIGSGTFSTVGSSGSIDGGTITTGLSTGAMNGTVNLGNATNVVYQSVGPNGVIDATSITSLTITQGMAGLVDVTGNLGSVSIGQNLSGEIEVTGSLGSVTVGGSTPGSIIAGSLGTVSAAAATGPVILQIEVGGIERQLQAATSSNLFPLPGQSPTGTLASTTFRYDFESGTLANPQLTVQVHNQSSSAAANQFDLSLVTDSATAKFNLARLDAIGVSGIGNVTVEGDILTSVSSQAKAYFPGDTNSAGIQLPQDKLAGVGVRDFIPSGGYINAWSIQAISVGLVGLPWGQSVVGSSASAYSVQSLLSSTTRVVQANNTFRVPFTGNTTYQVGFFMDDNTGSQFDWADVAFTIQSDVTINARGTANNVALSNVARGADVALIQVGLTSNGSGSQINGITIQGDGASFTTFQSIDGPILSSGTLGDLNLLGSSSVPSISAASIFGTITSYQPYAGTIQTTGLDTNPITGVVSVIAGDLGRTYLNAWNQVTTTTFETYSGSFTGQLIVSGNLVSNVIINGSSSGLIAVQGNIGTVGSNSRLGGITINGSETGTILSLGQILGNLTINGSLGNGGSIVASQGILGNLTINGGMSTGSKIVSGGVIGSSLYGTMLTVYGGLNGLIASTGALIEWQYDYSPSNTFSNVGTSTSNPNAVAIDAVLDGGLGNSTPITTLNLSGFNSMMKMLGLFHISKKGQLSVVAGS